MDNDALSHHHQVANGSRAGLREVRSALNNIGQLYRIRQEHAAAKEAFSLSLHLTPNDSMSLCNVMIAKRSLCEWDELDQIQEDVLNNLLEDLNASESGAYGSRAIADNRGQRSLPPYDAMLIPQTSADLQVRLTRAYLSGLQSISKCALTVVPPSISQQHKQLRLSYLSFDFRDHVIGHLTQGLLTSHDQARFLVQAASYGPPDTSVYRQRIQAGVADFKDMAGMAEVDAACGGIARDWRPHIAIDLMGVTRGTRAGLAALKPAPIMVNYLGFPGTVGSSYMDYIMVDQAVAPAETGAQSFSERLVILPHTYQANDYSAALPLADERKASSLGQRPAPVTYCNLNHVDKMEPTSFSVWMAILRRSPGSILNLLEPSGPSAGAVKANLQAEAASRGVLPSRLVFLPRVSKEEHLRRMPHSCDLFLDSFTYGAHSTASDALFTGVPMITMEGWGGTGDPLGKFPARVGASLLRSLDVLDTITYSPREFEDLAADLMDSAHQHQQEAMMSNLRHAVSARATFSVASITQNVEKAYEAMWEVHQSGMDPQHLVIHPEDKDQTSLDKLKDLEEKRMLGLLLEALREDAEKGNSASSLAISSRLLAAYPKSADSWHLRGLALLSAGDPQHLEQAPEHIIRAIELRDDVSFYHLNLAEAFLRLGRRDHAKKALLGCLNIDPSEVVAAVKLQRLLNEGWEIEEEAELFRWVMPHILARSDADSDPDVNSFLQLHALARAQIGDYAATVKLMEVAFQYFPDDHVAAMRYAAALEAVGQVDQAIDQFMHAVKLKHEHEFTAWPHWEQDQQAQTQPLLPRLAIYCDEYGQSWWGNWGPSSLGKGLGGSEESVIFIAREIAKLGKYSVEVYGSPSGDDIGRDAWGVLWLPHQTFDTSRPPQVFVAWRYHISLALGETSSQQYLWLQDLPSFATYTPSFLSNHVQAIFVLSGFHASLLPSHAQHLAVVTPNALDSSFFRDGPNKPWIFAYGSAPNRGLETLLRLWPRIYDQLSSSSSSSMRPELHVYYGFTAAFEKYAIKAVGQERHEKWMGEMHQLLQQPGIQYIGMVDHDTLAKGYAEAGFLLYPTTYPETGCVTLMKAMAMGAIPITSRFPNSTLPELTVHYDLGPRPLQSENPMQEDQDWLDLYVDAVVKAARDDSTNAMASHRKAIIEYARQRFRWEAVARIWIEHFTHRGKK